MVGLIVLSSGAFGAVQFHAAKTSESALVLAQNNLNQLQTAQSNLIQLQQDLEAALPVLKNLNLRNEKTDFNVLLEKSCRQILAQTLR